MKKGLIIVPYAYGGNTGVSIKNSTNQYITYIKNCCVACLSASKNAGNNTDVMLLTNHVVPHPYDELLVEHGVIIKIVPFDKFNFGSFDKNGNKINWQLAFYKLCALSYAVNEFEYAYYSFIDSDVFVQSSFENIWNESNDNILLYNLHEPLHGYMVTEMRNYLNTSESLTHFGGEFFAASNLLAKRFVAACENIFNQMNNCSYFTQSGDEFISSIVAKQLKESIKDANAYVHRYWTGSYRVVTNDYLKDTMAILHLPAEKEYGIIKLFNSYILKGKIPTNSVVWRICHLKRMSLRVRVGIMMRWFGLVK